MDWHPPASHDSDASPVRVVVRTVVDMSRTPIRRTAALRVPTLNASSAITVKRGHPVAMAGTVPATTAAAAVKVASTTMTTSSRLR